MQLTKEETVQVIFGGLEKFLVKLKEETSGRRMTKEEKFL